MCILFLLNQCQLEEQQVLLTAEAFLQAIDHVFVTEDANQGLLSNSESSCSVLSHQIKKGSHAFFSY